MHRGRDRRIGTVHGNYTANHFVLDQERGEVVEHGAVGETGTDNLFYVRSTVRVGLTRPASPSAP